MISTMASSKNPDIVKYSREELLHMQKFVKNPDHSETVRKFVENKEQMYARPGENQLVINQKMLEGWAKTLTHKEMVEAVEMDKLPPFIMQKEMMRRKKAREERKQLRVKQKSVMTQGKKKTPVAVLEYEVLSTENAEEMLKFPFSYDEVEALIVFYSNERPFWQQKMEFYKKVLGMQILTEKVNSFTKPQYAKGTVSYYADVFWGSRKRRDAFLAHVEQLEDAGSAQGDEPVLESESSLAGNANITFVEEREVDTDSTHISASISGRDRLMNMAERPWTSITDVLEREIVVHRGKWDETSNGEILSLGIPKCITDVKNTFVRRQLQISAFLRAGVELRIQFNGNRFAAGTLVFALLPPMFEEDVDGYVTVQSFNWPHVRIDATVSNVGTLFVPFTHILSHFPQRAGSLESDSMVTLGRLVVYCVNKLRVGEGASNILNYTVYARFVNPEVHQTTWPVEDFAYSDGIITQGDEGLFKRIIGGGLSTALGAFLSKMTGGLATGIGSFLTGLIFDYPRDPMPALPVVNTTTGPLCYGAGVDHSIRLGLTAIAQTETDPSVLGSTDGDFNIRTLLKIPSLLTTKTWTSSANPGERIFVMPVTPVYTPPNRILPNADETTVYTPTLQAYISRAFCYWRGGLKLKIQFIKTEYNNGRVLVSYTPQVNARQFPTTAVSDSLEYYNQANAVIIDIEEQKEVVIDLPYMSPRPWLRCDAFRTDQNYQAGGADAPFSYLGEHFCGFVSMFVLNRLVSPSNVPQDIDVNFFIYADDDFDLAYPTSLTPLNVRSFGQGSFGGYEEYPFVLGEKSGLEWDINFENKNWITSVYYDGARLFAAKKIAFQKAPKDHWWECTPVSYYGSTDEEVLTWCYKASLIAKYKEAQSGETNVQSRYMDTLPRWRAPSAQFVEDAGETQALEEYTTTRTSEPLAITSTVGKRTCEAAPQTVAENAMNLQTVLRRFYNIFTSTPLYTFTGYTMVTVPVNPSFVPIARYPIRTNKGVGYGEALGIDQVAWFTKLYTYWRGSLRYKFLYDTSMFDVVVVHVPTECREWSIRSGVKEIDVQRLMAFGSAIGVSQVQGALEVEVPYASPYDQLFVDVHNKYYDLRCQNGTLFFLWRNKFDMAPEVIKPMSFSLFRATADDFNFNVFKAPPLVEEPTMLFGFCSAEKGIVLNGPEEDRNLGNRSNKIAIPGTTGVKHVDESGYMRYCYAAVDPDPPSEKKDDKYFVEDAGSAQLFEEVAEFKKNVLESSGNLASLTRNLDELVKDARPTLNSLNSSSRKIDSFLSSVESTAFSGGDTSLLHKYALVASEVVLCGTFVHQLKSCLFDPSLSNLLTLGIELGLIVGLSTSQTLQSLLTRVVDWVLNIEDKTEQTRAQALDEVTNFIDDHCNVICGVVAVIGTVLYAYIFGALPSFEKIKSVVKSYFSSGEDTPAKAQSLESAFGFSLKNAHFAMLGMSALEKVFKKIMEWAQKFIFWMLDKENPEVVLARTACDIRDRVLNLIRELDDLDFEPNFIQALEDPQVHNRFYGLQDDIYELTQLVTLNKTDAKVVSLLTECRRRVTALIQRLEQSRCSATVRYDPFVICLHGDTGVGKTRFARKLFDVYKKVMGLNERHLLFTKSIHDQYWSGYSNQPLVLWDEFGQSKEADKIAIAEFMTLRGDKPVKLNMASLPEKGKDFTSQGIVMTTNVGYQPFNTVRDNQAFLRRRHIVIGMNHKKGYNANVLQEAAHDQFPKWEHTTFAILDNMEDKPKHPGVDMDWVLAYVEDKMTAWHTNQIAKLAAETLPALPRGVIPNPAMSEEDIIEALLEETPSVAPTDSTNTRAQHALGRLDARVFHGPPPVEEEDDFSDALTGEDDDSVLEAMIEEDAGGTQAFESMESAAFFLRDYGVLLNEGEEFEAALFMASYPRLPRHRIARIAYSTMRSAKQKCSALYELAKSVFDSLWTKMKNFWEQNPRIMKVLGVLTLLGGVGVIMHLRSSAEVEGGHYESGPSRPAARRVLTEGTYQSGPKPVAKHRVLSEGCEDPQAFEISKKVAQYVYPIAWEKGSVRASKMNCMHIGGHLIMAPYHFFDRSANGDRFNVLHRVHPVIIEFQKERMFRIDNKDWVIYDCGVKLEAGKQLWKFFIDEKSLGKVNRTNCMLITRDQETGDVCRDSGIVEPSQAFKYTDDRFGEVYVQTGWRHNLSTAPGSCGGPLFICAPNILPPGKIGGIHVAGQTSKSKGYCVLVTRQMLEKAVGHFGVNLPGEAVVAHCVERGWHDDLRIVPEGDFTIIGKMPNKMAPAQPLKTSLRETPFIDAAEEMLGPRPKIPARLRPFIDENGFKVSPLRNALGKYGHMTKPFPLRNIRKATNFLVHMFDQRLKHHTGKRVFAESEAVNGLPGVEFAEKMNMKSSPGWPYQVENRQPGKWHLFDEQGNIIDKTVTQRLHERIAAAETLQRVPSIWRDCMKDELRPVKKVLAGKTRLFTIAPVDFTIAVRQYFLDFVMAFYDAHRDEFFSAVGINPESVEWTELYNYLAEMNSKVIAGDYEMFDGKEMPELMMAVCDCVNAWYGDSEANQNVRHTLFLEMIHTMQVCENTVYMTHQGNPSGNPLTTVINTIVNYMLILLTWMEIFPDKTADDFSKNVRMKAYGDDNLIAVKEQYLKKFNQNTIAQALAKHNIVYTAETKSDASVPDARPLLEVSFLKRGFRRDPEFGSLFVLPVMSEETLHSYFYYYRQAENVQEQIQENQRSALLFAGFHGRVYYEEYLKKWQVLMRSADLESLQISFDEQVDTFRYGAGMMERNGGTISTEGFERFMQTTNSKPVRLVCGAIEAPFYYLAASLGLLSTPRQEEPTDDRWAVAIPSGEGKSTLARQYPWLFVDHDELLLPAFERAPGKLPWTASIARDIDFPKEDRRVLLVHHPSYTRRRLVGSFITPFPTFVRINCLQRLRLKNPTKMDWNERNILLVQLCSALESSLGKNLGAMVISSGSSSCSG